jgi:hypothetical protein
MSTFPEDQELMPENKPENEPENSASFRLEISRKPKFGWEVAWLSLPRSRRISQIAGYFLWLTKM